MSKEGDPSDQKQGKPGDDPFPSSEKMEELIKIRYEGSLQRKESVDDKANNMMSIAATVAALYGGFGLVSATVLFSTKFNYPDPSVFTLLIGVSLLVSCIIFSAKSYSIRDYYYAMKVDEFIEIKENDDDKTRIEIQKAKAEVAKLKTKVKELSESDEINEKKLKEAKKLLNKVINQIKSMRDDDYEWINKTIDDFRKLRTNELSRLMIKIYLGAIISNRGINDRKSKYLAIAQTIFFVGIATVPIFILVTSLNLD